MEKHGGPSGHIISLPMHFLFMERIRKDFSIYIMSLVLAVELLSKVIFKRHNFHLEKKKTVLFDYLMVIWSLSRRHIYEVSVEICTISYTIEHYSVPSATREDKLRQWTWYQNDEVQCCSDFLQMLQDKSTVIPNTSWHKSLQHPYPLTHAHTCHSIHQP